MKMKLPINVSSFNPQGFELAVSKDRTVDVPDAHVAVAMEHGLTPHIAELKNEVIKKDSRVTLTLDEGTVGGIVKAIKKDGSFIIASDDGEEYVSLPEFVAAEG